MQRVKAASWLDDGLTRTQHRHRHCTLKCALHDTGSALIELQKLHHQHLGIVQ